VQKHFKKLAAVHHVEATGTLDGTFHLFFDQAGLFTLSGVIVMLPEQRIREEIKRGSIDEAESLADAAREVGNLLVGSPFDNLEETNLSADGEFLYVLYEMTVEPYPSFRCAAVFPKAVLGASSSEVVEESLPQAVEEAPAAPPQEDAPEESVAAPVEASSQADAPTPVEAAKPAEVAPPVKAAPAPVAEPAPSDQTDAKPEVAIEQEDSKETPAVAEERPEPVEAPAPLEPISPVELAQIPEDIRPTVEEVIRQVGGAASEAPTPRSAEQVPKSGAGYIDRMFDNIVEYSSDTGLTQLLQVPAKDIMVTEVVWSEPEDTVQDVLAKMQQHNTGYVLVGRDGALEGLVSNSNLLSAISPYLRPMFAKWRRPEDDATLEIKIKWVMSRPVRTVTPDATLASMIESMRRYGGRCLPVVNSQANVQGIITVFDILLRILEADKAFSWAGRSPQAPPLLI